MPVPRGQAPFQHHTPNAEKEAEFCNATLNGIAQGLGNVVEMIQHPIDNVVEPLYTLASDIAFIGARYPAPDDPLSHGLFTHINENHPEINVAAMSRMNSRVANIQDSGLRFIEADSETRAETAAELLTTMLVPGALFKGIKATSIVARNLERFGVPIEPQKFHNLRLEISEQAQFGILTAQDIQVLPGYAELLYVITEGRELLFCFPFLEKPISRVTPVLKCKMVVTNKVYHSELAGFKDVYAAGEVGIFEGKIVRINLDSGHYRPNGSLLSRLVKYTFEKNGITDPLKKIGDTEWLTYLKPAASPTSAKTSLIRIKPGLETFATTAVNFAAPQGPSNVAQLVAEAYYSQKDSSLEKEYEKAYARLTSKLMRPSSPNLLPTQEANTSMRDLPSKEIIAPRVQPFASTKTHFETLANTLSDTRKSETRRNIDTLFTSAASSSLSSLPPLTTSLQTQTQSRVSQESYRFFSNSVNFNLPKQQAPSVAMHASPISAPFFSGQQAADRAVNRLQNLTSSYSARGFNAS